MNDWAVIRQTLLPVGIILLCLVMGVLIRGMVLRRLKALTDRSKTRLDDILLASLRSVIVIWALLLGMFISLQFLPLKPRDSQLLQRISQALLIFSIFWFLVQLLGKIYLAYSRKFQGETPAASIVNNAIKIFVFCIGLLVILQTMGVSITPLLTTLGVGGLAVALALQDTLANLFAGFHIIGTNRVKPNDYIMLESGEEGYVVDVTWRDTVLKQLHGNYIIIPNSRLSSAVVTNYHRPRKNMRILVEVGISYASDLARAEEMTLEVARQVLIDVKGGDETVEPLVTYHAFGESSINFTVHLWCREFVDKFLLQHEFIKALKKRYDQEGINIPFPIRTVIMKQN